MKAFTTVMKIAILLVTIALVAMLAISTIPLVTGGVNVETEEEVNITYDLAAVNVTGKYTVVSSIDQDISDLVIEAYLQSRDVNSRRDLVSVGPVTINKEHPKADIIIAIPIAEVALFFVADNMDKETPGLNLPVTIHVKGSYSSNLAGIDMRLVYNIPLSDTGGFSIGNTKTTESGDVSHAEISLTGIDGLASDLVPEGGAEFSVSLPGGKSLVIAGGMGAGCRLFSNELSPDRKARLDKVLSDSLPASLRKQVITSCSDGATWCRREGEAFSAILLDAPCSSERHVLADEKYLSQWSASRIKSLASRQWALLSSAWRLLVPGGFLLYATCALAPEENDGIASRLLKKFPDVCPVKGEELCGIFEDRLARFRDVDSGGETDGLVRNVFLSAEATELGQQVLPDSGGGAGPLYFALFRKDSLGKDLPG